MVQPTTKGEISGGCPAVVVAADLVQGFLGTAPAPARLERLPGGLVGVTELPQHGTLVPIDRLADERPYYFGKHRRHP